MPRADFYLIARPRFRGEPLRLVCELARKAHDAGHFTLVLARDLVQAEQLDDLLWDMGDEVYIPHQVAGADVEEEEAAVLIAPPEADVPLRPLVPARPALEPLRELLSNPVSESSKPD